MLNARLIVREVRLVQTVTKSVAVRITAHAIRRLVFVSVIVDGKEMIAVYRVMKVTMALDVRKDVPNRLLVNFTLIFCNKNI